jgi:hypothetical protein
MRCSKARDYLSRDLDGLLPPDATVGLRDHVEACEACRSFREDLVAGRRLLAATEPRLPENFEWKLQLRLNQALQQRAGETAYPWQEEPAPRRGYWLPAFSAAASVGLAAVLAFAVFTGPQRQTPVPDGRSAAVVSASVAASGPAVDAAGLAGRSDRRPLFGVQRGGGLYGSGIQRNVASGTRAADPGATINRGWSGDRLEDLQTIQQLRSRNDQLMRAVLQYQAELHRLKAQLDTPGGRDLDTGVSR